MALVKPSMTAPVSSYASTASATMTLMLALTYALEAAPNSLQAPVVKCQPSGTLKCNGKSYTTYECSPPVTSSTKALLTLNDFSNGGDGGGPSEFDENYQEKAERVVALSTGWYNGGSRCGKMIRITASNGKSVTAKVVDECDSMNGCDGEHTGQPPCSSKVVHGSDAVRNALGLNKDLGVVDVTWSMA